jgi:hypothetical protein
VSPIGSPDETTANKVEQGWTKRWTKREAKGGQGWTNGWPNRGDEESKSKRREAWVVLERQHMQDARVRVREPEVQSEPE